MPGEGGKTGTERCGSMKDQNSQNRIMKVFIAVLSVVLVLLVVGAIVMFGTIPRVQKDEKPESKTESATEPETEKSTEPETEATTEPETEQPVDDGWRQAYWDYLMEKQMLVAHSLSDEWGGFYCPDYILLRDCDWDGIPELYIGSRWGLYMESAGVDVTALYYRGGKVTEISLLSSEIGIEKKDNLLKEGMETDIWDQIDDVWALDSKIYHSTNEDEIKRYIFESEVEQSEVNEKERIDLIGTYGIAESDTGYDQVKITYFNGIVYVSVGRVVHEDGYPDAMMIWSGSGEWKDDGRIGIKGDNNGYAAYMLDCTLVLEGEKISLQNVVVSSRGPSEDVEVESKLDRITLADKKDDSENTGNTGENTESRTEDKTEDKTESKSEDKDKEAKAACRKYLMDIVNSTQEYNKNVRIYNVPEEEWGGVNDPEYTKYCCFAYADFDLDGKNELFVYTSSRVIGISDDRLIFYEYDEATKELKKQNDPQTRDAWDGEDFSQIHFYDTGIGCINSDYEKFFQSVPGAYAAAGVKSDSSFGDEPHILLSFQDSEDAHEIVGQEVGGVEIYKTAKSSSELANDRLALMGSRELDVKVYHFTVDAINECFPE